MAFGLLGGVFLCIALLVWSAHPVAPREERVARNVPAPEEAAPDVPVAAEAQTAPVETLVLDDFPEPVRRFLESRSYPSSSGRLTWAHEDLLQPNRRHERHRPIADTLSEDPSEIVTWIFTADRWAAVGPEVVPVWLEVRRGGEPIEVESVAAHATREGRAGRLGPQEPLRFQRDGDRLVAELPLARFADHFGMIAIDVRFEYAPGKFHEDELRIFSTPESRIPGRAAGEIRDRVSEGSLVLDVPVELDVAGFYRFDANLYDAHGEPVAFVSFKGELPAGAQEVPLEVYGKVLHDAGVAGPYTVDEVRGYRFLDGQHPDRELLPPLADAVSTDAWPLESFTDAPHISAHDLHMADLMLRDLEAGVPLFEPPSANVSASTTPEGPDASPAVRGPLPD